MVGIRVSFWEGPIFRGRTVSFSGWWFGKFLIIYFLANFANLHILNQKATNHWIIFSCCKKSSRPWGRVLPVIQQSIKSPSKASAREPGISSDDLSTQQNRPWFSMLFFREWTPLASYTKRFEEAKRSRKMNQSGWLMVCPFQVLLPLLIWVFPKMVGFPNKLMGVPTKNDQHLGLEIRGKTHHLRKHPNGWAGMIQRLFSEIGKVPLEVSKKSLKMVLKMMIFMGVNPPKQGCFGYHSRG